MTDEHFMGIAIDQARRAEAAGDVPVGAVIVQDGAVLATGFNRRQATGDPTAHAEIEALRAAAARIGNWRIEATIFVTQEPCPMCAGALVNARIHRLIYGCDNPKAGAVRSLFQIPTDTRLNHRVEIIAGVRATECGALLTGFFKRLRRGDREAEGV